MRRELVVAEHCREFNTGNIHTAEVMNSAQDASREAVFMNGATLRPHVSNGSKADIAQQSGIVTSTHARRLCRATSFARSPQTINIAARLVCPAGPLHVRPLRYRNGGNSVRRFEFHRACRQILNWLTPLSHRRSAKRSSKRCAAVACSSAKGVSY